MAMVEVSPAVGGAGVMQEDWLIGTTVLGTRIIWAGTGRVTFEQMLADTCTKQNYKMHTKRQVASSFM